MTRGTMLEGGASPSAAYDHDAHLSSRVVESGKMARYGGGA